MVQHLTYRSYNRLFSIALRIVVRVCTKQLLTAVSPFRPPLLLFFRPERRRLCFLFLRSVTDELEAKKKKKGELLHWIKKRFFDFFPYNCGRLYVCTDGGKTSGWLTKKKKRNDGWHSSLVPSYLPLKHDASLSLEANKWDPAEICSSEGT